MIHYFYDSMLKRNLILLLLLLPFALKAQYTYVTCADSSRINPYYKCYDSYQPVCACDGKTYRSACAADNWGGMITSHNYKPGVCGNFDFDFAPNPVSAISSSIQDAFLHIYINDDLLQSGISAEVYIFDVFNRIQYSRYFFITSNGPSGNGTSDSNLTSDFFSALQKGVYLLVVSVNGERQAKKIVKINIE